MDERPQDGFDAMPSSIGEPDREAGMRAAAARTETESPAPLRRIVRKSQWQLRFDAPVPPRRPLAEPVEEPISERSRSERPERFAPTERAAPASPAANDGPTRLAWWTATLAVLLAGWLIGPVLIERYSYARIKGEMLAQYDVAKTALVGDPAATLSMSGQWVSQKVRPSVVHIRTYGPDPTVPSESRGFGLSEGQGSGVVVDADGYLLTNQHVVAAATEIRVTLSDRREYRATLVGEDAETDLAVLKIDESGLIPIEWSDEDEIEVGALVWAIGSPFGLEQSTTQGIISAKHRRKGSGGSVSRHQDLIQSDVAINPGNSGGPLVDSRGRLIGINTSIVGEAYCGISFAVPSVVAREVYRRIRESGRVARGFLGVEPLVVPGHLVKRFGIAEGRGAYVDRVLPGRAAERAGIRQGDVILTWNGRPVENDIILFRMVGLTPVDQIVRVGLLRDGQPLELDVMIDPRDSGLRIDNRRPMIDDR